VKSLGLNRVDMMHWLMLKRRGSYSLQWLDPENKKPLT
jgi:hypothetical protein